MRAFLIFFALIIACATPAFAEPGISPTGHLQYCQRQPASELCLEREAVTLEYTEELRHLLESTTRKINSRMIWTSDKNVYGQAEYWTNPTGNRGDCDDFSLAKYFALRETLPAGALVMVFGKMRGSMEGHAVLGVQTTAGLMILGNGSDNVHPVGKSEIMARAIQDAANPQVWNWQ